jgi:hypothetical protein
MTRLSIGHLHARLTFSVSGAAPASATNPEEPKRIRWTLDGSPDYVRPARPGRPRSIARDNFPAVAAAQGSPDRKRILGRFEFAERHGRLPQIIHAASASRRFSRRLDRRECQRDDQSDDDKNDHELGQGKTRTTNPTPCGDGYEPVRSGPRSSWLTPNVLRKNHTQIKRQQDSEYLAAVKDPRSAGQGRAQTGSVRCWSFNA